MGDVGEGRGGGSGNKRNVKLQTALDNGRQAAGVVPDPAGCTQRHNVEVQRGRRREERGRAGGREEQERRREGEDENLTRGQGLAQLSCLLGVLHSQRVQVLCSTRVAHQARKQKEIDRQVTRDVGDATGAHVARTTGTGRGGGVQQ